MMPSCSTCNRQYNNLKQRSDCPHREFPQACSKHGRTNCGNIECQARPHRIEKVREEDVA